MLGPAALAAPLSTATGERSTFGLTPERQEIAASRPIGLAADCELWPTARLRSNSQTAACEFA